MASDGSAERVSLRAVLGGRRGAFLLALLAAEFGAAMRGIAYSTVLPVIATDLGGTALFGATLAAGPIAAVAMLSFSSLILRRVRPGTLLLAATLLYAAGASLAAFAPSMGFVLAGTAVRGVASGLFGGFGMGAIGALYDERERPRVFGLFSLVWLLPSIVGPPLNAVITQWIDWRWAIAWPALLILLARMLMAFTIRAVPWQSSSESGGPSPAAGLVLIAALGLAAWTSATGCPWSAGALAVALAEGAAATGAFLLRGNGREGRVVAVSALVCAAFFGLHETLALTVVEGLRVDLLWAAAAVTGSLLARSVVGLRPAPNARPDRVVVGAALILTGIGLALVALHAGSAGPPVLVAAAVAAGAGMGASYPLLASEPFTPTAPTTTVGPLVAFAETAGTAWVALYAGGSYSALRLRGLAAADALSVVYAALAAVALAAVLTAARRPRLARGGATPGV